MEELVNKTYNRLTLIKFDKKVKSHVYWLCSCTCGVVKSVRLSHLELGNVQSCGCLQKERTAIASLTHGHSSIKRTTEYRSWESMISRCNNPNATGYSRYGGKGIKVCERWLKFTNFLQDMGLKPAKGYSIDRVDNNGNYELSNCRWASAKTQANNRNNNLKIKNNDSKNCK